MMSLGLSPALPKNLPVLSGVTYRGTDLKDWLASLGVGNKTMVGMNQTHSNHCNWVPDTHRSEEELLNTDACLTTNPNHLLKVRTADCLPIILYHPHPIIGVIHAGRRGTESRILVETLAAMQSVLNEPIDGLYIWFGPAICKGCYQIDRETDLHYDLIAENKAQLSEILPESAYQLTLSDRCTACENDRFFSYRKEGPKSGRIYSFVTIT